MTNNGKTIYVALNKTTGQIIDLSKAPNIDLSRSDIYVCINCQNVRLDIRNFSER